MRKNVVKSKVAKVLATGCTMAFVLGAMPAVNAESYKSNDYVTLTVQEEQSQNAKVAAIKVMEAAKLGLIEENETKEALKNEQIKMAKDSREEC